jgi:hypothetical protein
VCCLVVFIDRYPSMIRSKLTRTSSLSAGSTCSSLVNQLTMSNEIEVSFVIRHVLSRWPEEVCNDNAEGWSSWNHASDMLNKCSAMDAFVTWWIDSFSSVHLIPLMIVIKQGVVVDSDSFDKFNASVDRSNGASSCCVNGCHAIHFHWNWHNFLF